VFNVVLVEPEIPPNTGNVGRLCLATGSTLHLVEPLGFSTDDRQVKRAGLDYWDEVQVRRWPSFEKLNQANRAARFFYLTTKAQRPYFEAKFAPGDFLVFGRETKGLPEKLLCENAETCLTIPMHGTRSLNLATAVAIVLYEAVRQNFEAPARTDSMKPVLNIDTNGG
jgi:tRNA (cytidine/uridine-2'-O-)-methyltransferase